MHESLYKMRSILYPHRIGSCEGCLILDWNLYSIVWLLLRSTLPDSIFHPATSEKEGFESVTDNENQSLGYFGLFRSRPWCTSHIFQQVPTLLRPRSSRHLGVDKRNKLAPSTSTCVCTRRSTASCESLIRSWSATLTSHSKYFLFIFSFFLNQSFSWIFFK